MRIGTVRLFLFAPVLLAVPPLAAQDYFPHHNFTFGSGVARPRGDLGFALDDAPGVSVAYGYRFHRFFQADVGFDSVFGAAQVRDYLATDLGFHRISDREYFLPFGGRAIAPLFHGRFLLQGGGGGVWMKYHERVNQPGEYLHIDCPSCTSRSGWGTYALANASYFVDSGHHFRVGVTSRMIWGNTDGDPIGLLRRYETKDRWLSLGGEFGFSF
jgi:hypothetical protein